MTRDFSTVGRGPENMWLDLRACTLFGRISWKFLNSEGFVVSLPLVAPTFEPIYTARSVGQAPTRGSTQSSHDHDSQKRPRPWSSWQIHDMDRDRASSAHDSTMPSTISITFAQVAERSSRSRFSACSKTMGRTSSTVDRDHGQRAQVPQPPRIRRSACGSILRHFEMLPSRTSHSREERPDSSC